MCIARAFKAADWIILADLPSVTADGKPPGRFVELAKKLNDENIPGGFYYGITRTPK